MEKMQKVVKKLPENCLSCRFLDDSDLPNFFCDVTCEMLNATGKEEIDQKRHDIVPSVAIALLMKFRSAADMAPRLSLLVQRFLQISSKSNFLSSSMRI